MHSIVYVLKISNFKRQRFWLWTVWMKMSYNGVLLRWTIQHLVCTSERKREYKGSYPHCDLSMCFPFMSLEALSCIKDSIQFRYRITDSGVLAFKVSCNQEICFVSLLCVCNFNEAKCAGILQDDSTVVKKVALVYFNVFYNVDAKEMKIIKEM